MAAVAGGTSGGAYLGEADGAYLCAGGEAFGFTGAGSYGRAGGGACACPGRAPETGAWIGTVGGAYTGWDDGGASEPDRRIGV